MRRTALFLLTLHLAAVPVLAQSAAPPGTLEIHQGDRVTTYNHGAAPADTHQTAAPTNETLITFDPQRAEVVWTQNHWQLIADGHILKDFARREVEARLALRLVRELHLTQQGVVGSPEPVMEYWLSNGHAPHGVTSGLHITPVDLASLKAEQVKGQWCVRDANHVLFSFRTNESDARNALAILRKYAFTQIGTVGNMGPSMIVMLGHFDAGVEASQNYPHLTPLSPVRSTPADPKAQQQALGNDNNPSVTPAVPPLRSAAEPRKQVTINEFGHTETVEVLPQARASLHPMNDAQVRQAMAVAQGQTAETGPTNGVTIVSHTPPTPQMLEAIERTPLDWRQFQVRQEKEGQFSVAAGNFVLGHFRSDHDAHLAIAAMQHYRFTELDHVGRPKPLCSYFLCNGQAPRGQFIGMQTEPFQPERLTVAQIDNHWAIMTQEKPLLHFGDKPDEARLMLDVIQRQQFDRLCRIGDEHGLTFFVRSH